MEPISGTPYTEPPRRSRPGRLIAAAGLLALLACSPPPISPSDVAGAARAMMRPTEGNETRGTVSFEPMRNGGLMVKASMTGLTPGPHGFHVHVYGDCSAPDASSAGGHFDFLGTPSRAAAESDPITGNLGQLEAGPDGTATVAHLVQDANLWGPASIIGRAVVVHAQGNDPDSPPDGAAGPRIACGVIGIVQPDT